MAAESENRAARAIISNFGEDFMNADGNEVRAILAESGRMLQDIRGFL